jgi:hypothetical protein
LASISEVLCNITSLNQAGGEEAHIDTIFLQPESGGEAISTVVTTAT